MKLNKLTEEEKEVILGKGTEKPSSGKYDNFSEPGIYICKQCNAPLYRSSDKFDSKCGWPSFDDELPGAVKRVPDPDGTRTEIQCARCGAHLGHVFKGEELTPKNIRHCVNSISLKHVPAEEVKTAEIVLGGGCFWCTEAAFKLVHGVLSVTPGYAGGTTENPTYEKVCSGETGHAEVIKIEFLPDSVSPEELLDVFFTVHDPTTPNRQGADTGTQYRSLILYSSDEQKTTIEKYIGEISGSYTQPVVTEIKKLQKFYPAEDYHKDYFEKNPSKPYCVLVVAPKVDKVKKKLGNRK